METLIEKLKLLRSYFTMKRNYSGYFIIGKYDKQFPLADAKLIEEIAYNYYHLRFKLWYKYGNCKMICCTGGVQY